ncbi:MAG: hypothetical protein H0T78_09015 [Longispora sp.]|nr:hypothetical protein [Longispora sp. (in: high G+C Gram-positive bacteria)]
MENPEETLTIDGGIAEVRTAAQFQEAMELSGLTEVHIYTEDHFAQALDFDRQPMSGAKVTIHSGLVHLSGLAEIAGVHGGEVYAKEAAIIYNVAQGNVVASDGVQIKRVSGGAVIATGQVRIENATAGIILADDLVEVYIDGVATCDKNSRKVNFNDELSIFGPELGAIPDSVTVKDANGLVCGPEAAESPDAR